MLMKFMSITYIYIYIYLITGFHQPDEDDYGYASKDAMDIYNNIMNKYVNTPTETKSTKTINNRSYDISGTKVCCVVDEYATTNKTDF